MNQKRSSLKEKKYEYIESLFKMGQKDFKYISGVVDISQQQVRNLYLKWEEHQTLKLFNPGPKIKLNQDQLNFIKEFYAKPNNFDKTINDLTTELVSA